jgi:GTP-binding protein
MHNQEKIRNIAIIAHVDHGKTTLVDAFLKQTNVFRENQEEMKQEMILDFNDLEREKGITIKAKNIAIVYKDFKINIIDTPGHADFGGEVERTLNMADGCLLLVDAQEGVMPQTKFVLRKALELGLKTIVVINKIDKAFAEPLRVASETQDLFLELAMDESQLEFPILYAIGRDGMAWKEMPDLTKISEYKEGIKPLLDEILNYIPAPTGDLTEPFRMQISSLDYDAHLGRLLIGKIDRGILKNSDSVVVVESDQPAANKIYGRVKNLFCRKGMNFEPIEEAIAGDIVAFAGIETTAIGGTVCSPEKIEPLKVIKISEPSVQIKFEANTSPMVGKEGKFVTAKLLQQRLEKEAELNVSLKITKTDGGGYNVAGRGELQLAILIEELRREGYEFQVRRPEVIFREENGVKLEPIEELVIDVPTEYQGSVQAALSERRAEMLDMKIKGANTRFTYKILTRNLLGLRTRLINDTKGNVVLNNFLLEYVPYTKQPEQFRKGVIVSIENGIAMGYALNTIQERGDLFIEPMTPVYEGMIIGIHKYDNDLEVNPCKERQKSGVRIKHDEITQTVLKAIKPVTIDFALLFLAKDEILEVTPKSLRLRKQYLTKTERDWSKRTNLTDFAKKQMGIE